ncbi:hypothetical protein L3V86_00255 [Thiotrichales bacterium 19S11-10]|nr:hypothetical protein [Thiotrichales bacterium 19S11-10]
MIDIQILVNNNPLSNTRLNSILVIDKIGDQADHLELTYTNASDQVNLSKPSSIIDVSMGSNNKLYNFGKFSLSEMSISQPSNLLKLKGSSVPFFQVNHQSLQSQYERSFKMIAINDLVSLIAKESGLAYSVSKSIGQIIFEQIDQNNESNIAFLKRLANVLEADLKITYQRILLLEKQAQTVNGENIKPVTLSANDFKNLNYHTTKRNYYRSAIVSYHQLDKGGINEIQVGEGQPIYRSSYTYENKENAIKIAKQILKDRSSEKDKLQFSVANAFHLRAGMPIEIQDLTIDIPNSWVITEAKHHYSKTGYVVDVSARLL